MEKELEFSMVYNLLNAVKEGDQTKKEELNLILNEYMGGKKAESFLQELGLVYIYIGLKELFNYTDSFDLQLIGKITKEEWDLLATKNNGELPVHLANTMINYVKDKKLLNKLSLKWKISQREIQKHVRPMSAYITEGIIDVLE